MKPMITVEAEKDGEVVYMHTDSAGISQLINQLTRLKDRIDSGENDHLHFMTEGWGGNELSNQPQAENGSTTLVHHLKVFGWTEEKKKKLTEPVN